MRFAEGKMSDQQAGTVILDRNFSGMRMFNLLKLREDGTEIDKKHYGRGRFGERGAVR